MGLRLGARLHHEARAALNPVLVVETGDVGVGAEAGGVERGAELLFQRREGVEHGGGEHVAGDPTDRIQMQVHPFRPGDAPARSRRPAGERARRTPRLFRTRFAEARGGGSCGAEP